MTTGPNLNRERWSLCLYIAGREEAKSQSVYSNVMRICEEHLPGDYELRVVDLSETPEAAAAEQILALPTLVRLEPKPTRRIIGDLTDTDRVLISLGVKAMVSPAMDISNSLSSDSQ